MTRLSSVDFDRARIVSNHNFTIIGLWSQDPIQFAKNDDARGHCRSANPVLTWVYQCDLDMFCAAIRLCLAGVRVDGITRLANGLNNE
jgi:hypothetical protein